MTPTRRRFLQLASAALAAGLTAPRWLEAAASRSEVRPIGFSLYGMKSLPVLEALDHCVRIGYNNVEICVMDGFPTELGSFDRPQQLAVRDRLRANNLEVSSLLFHGNVFQDDHQQEILETIKAAGEISHVLDEKNPPLLETVIGGRTDQWHDSRDMMLDRLHAWAEAAASVGVKVAVKGHYGHAVHSPERLLWLYRHLNHPNLALTYDYSHFKAAGFEMEETMRALIPHTSFVHVKDVAPWKPVRFLYPGEGTIDWVKYFSLLWELDYQGPILVEVSAHIHRLPRYEPLPAAEKCYKSLAAARDQAFDA